MATPESGKPMRFVCTKTCRHDRVYREDEVIYSAEPPCKHFEPLDPPEIPAAKPRPATKVATKTAR